MRPQEPLLTPIRAFSKRPESAAAVVSGDCH
jgi:hypothetical protein